MSPLFLPVIHFRLTQKLIRNIIELMKTKMGNMLFFVICSVLCVASSGCQTKAPTLSNKLSPTQHHLGIYGQVLENFYNQGLFITSDSGQIRFFETNINGRDIQESYKIAYPGELIDWNMAKMSDDSGFGWVISSDKGQKFLTGFSIQYSKGNSLEGVKKAFVVKTDAQKAGFFLEPEQSYFESIIVCENAKLDKIYYYNRSGRVVFSYSTKPLLLGKGIYCYDGNTIFEIIRMENDPKKPFDSYQPLYLQGFSGDVANYNPVDCVISENAKLFCRDGAYFYTPTGVINLGVREEFVDELPDSSFILIKGSLRYSFVDFLEITAGLKLVEAQKNNEKIKLLANDRPNWLSEVCYYCTITEGGDTLFLNAAVADGAINTIKKFSLGTLKKPQLFLTFNGGMLIDSENIYHINLSDVESYSKSLDVPTDEFFKKINMNK
jgi:hypothetical protein